MRFLLLLHLTYIYIDGVINPVCLNVFCLFLYIMNLAKFAHLKKNILYPILSRFSHLIWIRRVFLSHCVRKYYCNSNALVAHNIFHGIPFIRTTFPVIIIDIAIYRLRFCFNERKVGWEVGRPFNYTQSADICSTGRSGTIVVQFE